MKNEHPLRASEPSDGAERQDLREVRIDEASHEKLRAVIARWRRTADIWEAQMGSYWPSAPRGIERAPERGRSGVKNWINWLRACANEIESAIGGPR